MIADNFDLTTLENISGESLVLATVLIFTGALLLLAYWYRPVYLRRLEFESQLEKQRHDDDEAQTTALSKQTTAIEKLADTITLSDQNQSLTRQSIDSLVVSCTTLHQASVAQASVAKETGQLMIQELKGLRGDITVVQESVDKIPATVQDLLIAMEQRLVDQIKSDPSGLKDEFSALRTQVETWLTQLQDTINKLSSSEE